MARRQRTSRKKKGSGAAAISMAVLLTLLLGAGVAAWLAITPYGPESETFVVIAQGSGTARIGQQLESAGVVRSLNLSTSAGIVLYEALRQSGRIG